MPFAGIPSATARTIDAVRKGLPTGRLTRMAQLLAVDRELLLRILGVSARTIQRKHVQAQRPSRSLAGAPPLKLLDTDAGYAAGRAGIAPDPVRLCVLNAGALETFRAPHGPGLDSIGGLFAEGRWHTRGERVVYFGASAAIVVLEPLAHKEFAALPPIGSRMNRPPAI